jgi:hypothetical protein
MFLWNVEGKLIINDRMSHDDIVPNPYLCCEINCIDPNVHTEENKKLIGTHLYNVDCSITYQCNCNKPCLCWNGVTKRNLRVLAKDKDGVYAAIKNTKTVTYEIINIRIICDVEESYVEL